MDDDSHRPYVYGSGDRRLEVVSGGARPVYYWLDPPALAFPVPARPSWSGQGAGVAAKPWAGLTDPEMKRRKRIARYKAYSVEGKVKASLRRGIQWIKNKCSQIVHGY